jgi:parallel beta-helix repeat protein
MRKILIILFVGLLMIMLLPVNTNAASYSEADGDGFCEPNEPITFQGDISYFDEEGIQHWYENWYWDLDEDGSYESPGRVKTTTFADEGTYTVTLYEINNKAKVIEFEIEITRGFQISDADGDGVCEPHEPITFIGDDNYYDKNGDINWYSFWEWDFNNDGTIDANGQEPTHTFHSPGIYPVTMNGINDDEHVITLDIEVKHSYTISDADGDGVCEPGELITFTGDATYYDEFGSEHDYVEWLWDFDGDGSSDYSGKSISHTFQDDSIYKVTLIESNGESVTITEDVEVQYNILIDHYGNIEPSNAPIDQNGNTYTLSDDIFGKIYIVGFANVKINLDGAGHDLFGSGSGKGIYAIGQMDLSIKNFNIFGFEIGLYMVECSYSAISNNIIYDNEIGICLGRSPSKNVFKENIIMNNNYGIQIKYYKYYFGNSKFYHNDFINNNVQVDGAVLKHKWDNGAGEGNYWSDYNGLDDGSNSRTVGDGIGDTDLPHNGVDNYPLMEPWNVEDMVQIIIEDIEDMDLPAGAKNSLEAILNSVIKSIENDNDKAGEKQLEAFITMVTALRNSNKLADDEADLLIDKAQWIIDHL